MKNNLDKNIQKKLASFCASSMSHAVLLTGGSREERAEAARYLSSAIVCARQNARPCGQCEACLKAKNDTHPDVIVFDKPQKKRYFVKEEVRLFRQDVFRTPNEASVKAYILPELQNMNEECQNLLLNILEEPPVYAAFVLTASSKDVLLGTILSRVVRLSLSSGNDKDASEKAVKAASEIAGALLSADEYDIFKATAPLEGDKELFEETLGELLLLIKDAFTAAAHTDTKMESGCKKEVAALSQSLSKAQLIRMYDDVAALLDGFEKNKNQAVMLTVLCAQLRQTAQK